MVNAAENPLAMNGAPDPQGPQLIVVQGNFGRAALYPHLKTAEELGMTPEQHGEHIVQSNALLHPEVD